MYRGMDIGTAKASAQEQAEVRHHLIDIIEPSESMSVARFQELARNAIAEIQSRGLRPILVGGSGLICACSDRRYYFSLVLMSQFVLRLNSELSRWGSRLCLNN